MADEKALTQEQSRQRFFNEIIQTTNRDLAKDRQICASHFIDKMQAKAEAAYGPDSFPEGSEYCLAALKESVDRNQTGALYLNLGLQQLEQGQEFDAYAHADILTTGKPARQNPPPVQKNMAAIMRQDAKDFARAEATAERMGIDGTAYRQARAAFTGLAADDRRKGAAANAIVTESIVVQNTADYWQAIADKAQIQMAASGGFTDDAPTTVPNYILRHIRAAAERGDTSYADAAGRTVPLTCPQALDAGVTWATANPEAVDRPGFTDEQVGRMAKACYNPDITEANIAATGETITAQKMGLIAGELLGKRYHDELKRAAADLPAATVPGPSSSGELTPSSNIPIPTPKPKLAAALP
ncbi:hypothetical protein [Jiella sonneratiae]|uniref:Uncharacterized protein n=1 Tax=Jiella sonneratiae TaxID=2816856 RepID=A0ABS3J9D4_9HYPH|nr:hypothetical protein [Jiella sonneratiae]MBO0906286.1 hypothetical protein [Jiella sonneratiae]